MTKNKIYSRIAGLINDSIVDGPGIRYTVFYQGCNHHCKNCHNPETWNCNGGNLIDNDEIIEKIKKNPLLSGVTLSGGDPLIQVESVLDLCKKIKALDMDLNIIIYTGYVFDELLEMSKTNEVLNEILNTIDYIIDGKYIDELRDLTLAFRGSKNQRIIDVKASIQSKTITTLEW